LLARSLARISCFISVLPRPSLGESFLEIAASPRYVHLLPDIYHREKNKSFILRPSLGSVP
jgi:hypothetical protein